MSCAQSPPVRARPDMLPPIHTKFAYASQPPCTVLAFPPPPPPPPRPRSQPPQERQPRNVEYAPAQPGRPQRRPRSMQPPVCRQQAAPQQQTCHQQVAPQPQVRYQHYLQPPAHEPALAPAPLPPKPPQYSTSPSPPRPRSQSQYASKPRFAPQPRCTSPAPPRLSRELPAQLRISQPSSIYREAEPPAYDAPRFRQSLPAQPTYPAERGRKYVSSYHQTVQGIYAPFHPQEPQQQPTKQASIDDITALVQAEIDEIARQHKYDHVKSQRPTEVTSVPSGVKAQRPTVVTSVPLHASRGEVPVMYASPSLHSPEGGPDSATSSYSPQVLPPTPVSPVMVDKPLPKEYKTAAPPGGLYSEIRRMLTFREKLAADAEEEEEEDEYTDDFEEVVMEYGSDGFGRVRIGTVRRLR